MSLYVLSEFVSILAIPIPQKAGHYSRAFFILDECIEIEPDNPLPYMVAAKVAIEKLVDYEKGKYYLGLNEACTINHPKYHEYKAICYRPVLIIFITLKYLKKRQSQ